MQRTMPRTSPLPLGPDVTRRVESAAAREWLITNGRGDYACGTVAGPNTRREHGLFVADAGPARPAILVLAALDVALERNGERYPVSCHQYRDARHPEGYRYCTGFRPWPFPEWRYEFEGARLIVRLFMPNNLRAVVCAWTLAPESAADWRLHVRPLFAFREIAALTRANPQANLSMERRGRALRLAPYPGCPEAFIHAPGSEVRAEPCWYYNFLHPWDVALGNDGLEDLFSPGVLVYRLAPGDDAALVVGLDERMPARAELEAQARREVAGPALPALEDDPLGTPLALAAAQFVARGGDGAPYIATGYPTPVSRLRDTLIALPGILLCTRRLDEARAILVRTTERLLADDAPPDDVPLWAIRAGELYVDHSRDWDFLRDVLTPAAHALLQRYARNASGHGFRQDADGLLRSSDPSRPLTWMDARVGGWPVTPRAGKPVEVNALWHHALGLMVRWMRRRGDAEAMARYAHLQELCAKSFRHRFWNPATKGLFDVVDAGRDGRDDPAIRPNQIFAVALPTDLLDRPHATAVLRLVENRLLTPMGLRTLSLEDRAFRPRYAGGEVERAGALHQGSVFPWLLGPYVDAVFRVHGRTSGAFARAEQALDALLARHLAEGCVGQIAELFDGAAPQAPRGAFADARAIGEVIRARVELQGWRW